MQAFRTKQDFGESILKFKYYIIIWLSACVLWYVFCIDYKVRKTQEYESLCLSIGGVVTFEETDGKGTLYCKSASC